MEIKGKIIAVLPPQSGTSQTSGKEWKVQSFVLETQNEQYPKKVCFEVFGEDRLQAFNIQLNDVALVQFDIDAHEYKGRWYNSVRAFAYVKEQPQQQPAYSPAQQPVTAPLFPPEQSKNDDLPF